MSKVISCHVTWVFLLLCQCTGTISGEAPSGFTEPDQNPTPGPSGGSATPGFHPAPGALRKLTLMQYQSSVHDVVAQEIMVPAGLEQDGIVNGYTSIAAAQSTFSPIAVEKLEQAAYDIAAQAMAEPLRSRFFGCSPSAIEDAACAAQALDALGLRAFRRPLTTAERDRFVGLAGRAAGALGNFYAGMEFGIAALLQSIPFLYRVELGEPDPADRSRFRYTSSELASRLSYLIWNTTPDAELLTAVVEQRLSDPVELASQAARLLASPRASAGLEVFHEERFGLLELSHVSKAPQLFPAFGESLVAAMRQEVRQLAAHVVAGAGDYRQLLTTPTTFVNAELAKHYGVSYTGSGFQQVTFSADSGRAGLLTSAALMSLNAGTTQTSPSRRGKFVRENLLCQSIPLPPPGVVTVIPEQSGTTMREKLATHAADPSCATCHRAIDPIGLAFEHFDAVGAYRETDGGAELDVSGELDGQAFADARGLAELLGASPDFATCTVRSLYRHAFGHVEGAGQEPLIAQLTSTFGGSGYRFDALLRALAESEALRFAAPPQD